MIEAGIGRLLVASLHQAIADLLPTRLEFYESWLNPAGLRDGRIGLAPLAAVLSFLRLEGEPYRLIVTRAGEYAADWTVAELPPLQRTLLRAMPAKLRLRLVTRIARDLIRHTYGGSRALIQWRRGRAAVDVRGSIFCAVRERTAEPLCDFYAAALRRLMFLFNLDAAIATEHCRATGDPQCLLSISPG